MSRRFVASFFCCLPILIAACSSTNGTPDVQDVGTDLLSDSANDIATGDVPTSDVTRCALDRDCDDGVFCNGAERCMPGASGADGRGCIAASPANPCTTSQSCNEAAQRCEAQCATPDADHDGHRAIACGGDDCDDNDPNRYPGNTEVCVYNAAMMMRVDPTHDEDCDATTFANGATADGDHDGDGFVDHLCCNVDRSGMRNCGLDCVDFGLVPVMAPFTTMVDPSNVHPFQTEACNGVDDNCNNMVDDGLPQTRYYRDCDGDGSGDAMDPGTLACGPAQISACSGNPAVTNTGDCDDANRNRSPSLTEVCNGVDDNCNMLVDDVSPGVVFCHQGETSACSTACGLSGTRNCSATCLAWDTCSAPEVCNGCDDNNNGSVDDGFACSRGTSQACTVPICGTAGLQTCTNACAWGACTGTEVCNYCDDNGNGNFFEERPLAALTTNAHLSDCSGGTQPMFGTATSCSTTPTANGFDLWAQLLDGAHNNEAGALWLDPANWTMGWGPVDVSVDMEVTAVTAGGAYEIPLGGWSVIIGHGGTIGVGTPHDGGIPTTISGVAARYFWSDFDFSSSNPPIDNDSSRAMQLGLGIGGLRAIGTPTDSTLYSGDGLLGGTPWFDGVASGTMTQHMQLRYTPDDPTTPANEELVTVTAGAGGSLITRTYSPTVAGVMPVGTAPLRIGITAGSYTQSGFTGPPAGSVFGVPVRARVRVMHQEYNCCGAPTFTYPVNITRQQLCP